MYTIQTLYQFLCKCIVVTKWFWVLVADYGMGLEDGVGIQTDHERAILWKISRHFPELMKSQRQTAMISLFPQCLLMISMTQHPHTAERWTYAALLHCMSGTQRLCISPRHIWSTLRYLCNNTHIPHHQNVSQHTSALPKTDPMHLNKNDSMLSWVK